MGFSPHAPSNCKGHPKLVHDDMKSDAGKGGGNQQNIKIQKYNLLSEGYIAISSTLFSHCPSRFVMQFKPLHLLCVAIWAGSLLPGALGDAPLRRPNDPGPDPNPNPDPNPKPKPDPNALPITATSSHHNSTSHPGISTKTPDPPAHNNAPNPGETTFRTMAGSSHPPSNDTTPTPEASNHHEPAGPPPTSDDTTAGPEPTLPQESPEPSTPVPSVTPHSKNATSEAPTTGPSDAPDPTNDPAIVGGHHGQAADPSETPKPSGGAKLNGDAISYSNAISHSHSN